MPQVVAVVIKVAVAALIKVGVSKAIAFAITKFVITLAVSAAISAAARAFQPKPPGGSMDQGAEIRTKIEPAYPREVAIGKFATGGSLVYENVSGTNNEYYWRVIAISDCEIEEVTAIHGNGVALTFSGDIHTGLRACTSHFQSASGGDMLSARVYRGTSTQTVDPDLDAAFADITSNFRGRGVAYVILRLQWDPDAWSSGFEFFFTGKGAKILDTRTATTAWTENGMLIAGQFLQGFENNGIRVVGLGCEDDDVPEAMIEAGADECDENVSLAAGGTEDRYRVGGMISARETARDVLVNLCAAMSARHIDRGGEIVILPGVARTPVLDFEEGDLLTDEPFTYVGRRTADERVNAISSTYVSPDDAWQESQLPPRKNATAITEDGDRYETSRAYRYVNSKTQGQRLDEIELRRARKEGWVQCSAPLWAFQLEPGDWVTATDKRWGGVSKTFEIETVELRISTQGGGVARCGLTMRETASSVFSWSTSDEITNGIGAVTQPTPLESLTDAEGRIITVDGLPIGALGGTGLIRSVTAPLSSASSSTIEVAEHDVTYVGRVYELPADTLTGLSTDTGYAVFWDIQDNDYDATTSPTSFIADASRYIPVGVQRTQDGGGGFTPPPPPPPGGGGGSGGGGGGFYPDP